MRIFTTAQRLMKILGKRQSVWAIWLVLTWLSGPALGQVGVTETGLHDANQVFGIDASSYLTPWTNSDTVSLLAWGETDPNLYSNVSFYAYGIFSDANLVNLGAIDVNAIGGQAYASTGNVLASIYSYGLHVTGDVNNSGDLTVTGTAGTTDANDSTAYAFAQVYGVYAEGNVRNSGDITVTGMGGMANSPTSTANTYIRTYGIFGDADVDNSGAITVTGTAGHAETGSTSSYAYAYADVYGIYAYGNLNNSGTVTATATGGTADSSGNGSYYAGAQADATAWGLYGYGAVDNTGVLAVTATGGQANSLGSPAGADAEAYGIYDFSGDVRNTAGITVTATGGTADANNGSSSAYAYAYGIRGNGNVDNSGTLTATATGGSVDNAGGNANAEAYGIYTNNGDVNNSGNITVAASAEDGFTSTASGIYMYGNGNLTNTGIIRATGDDAYELYVASGTTTLVDTYNVTLDGDPNEASIYVANEATLALNDATLTVTEVDGETLWDTEYRLFAPAGGGVVDGNFAQVRAVNPDVTATYYTLGTAGAADDTVSLSYAPEASETLASSAVQKQLLSHATGGINRHMTTILLDYMLDADTGDSSFETDSADETTASQSPCQRASGMFFEPYYSHIDKDADPLGYDAGMWGFSAGRTQCVGNSLLGLHLGYGKSNIDYTGTGYSTNSEDQGVATGGFSGLARWKRWTLRYGLTGFHGWHDYRGLTGLSLNESEIASYNSYGGSTTIAVGRTFKRGPHVFFPEIGGTWLWLHRQQYTTVATDASWDTTYSALDDHDFLAEASLHWQSRYKYHKVRVVPSVSIGIHNLLTDPETAAWQSIRNADRVEVKSQQDRTALLLAGSVVLSRFGTSLTLAYDGEYSSDVQRHSAWLRCKWLF